MEGNVQVDQIGLIVAGGPVDKYENPTTLNGDPQFLTSNSDIVEFRKATQEEIDAYNADPNTPEELKIKPTDIVGAWKSKETVGASLLEIVGDPTPAEGDTPIRMAFTLHVGAGGAAHFGEVRLAGAKEDPDEN